MIRWATEADRWPLIRLMQRNGAGWTQYDYSNMDGAILVYERRGEVLGFIRFWLGRPESYVRQTVVDKPYRRGMVARALYSSVIKLAKEYGSQGVEGVVSHDLGVMAAKTGAKVESANWVRFKCA